MRSVFKGRISSPLCGSGGHEDRQVSLAAAQALDLAAAGAGGQMDGHIRMAAVEGPQDGDERAASSRHCRAATSIGLLTSPIE
jgi:hypothetical protein